MTDSLKRARELLAELHPECTDAFEYDCDGVGAEKIAAALDAWAQEARLEEAKWWFEQYCPTEDPRAYERIAALEQRTK